MANITNWLLKDTVSQLTGIMTACLVIGLIGISLYLITQPVQQAPSTTMSLTSSNFTNNGTIPSTFTCSGDGKSPELTTKNVPAGAKSLALVVTDSDVIGGPFTHWLMWNIDPSTTTISGNNAPEGAIVGTNSSNKTGYLAPCPPSGTHHYHFKLYALDNSINLSESSTTKELTAAMSGHILAQAMVTGIVSNPL